MADSLANKIRGDVTREYYVRHSVSHLAATCVCTSASVFHAYPFINPFLPRGLASDSDVRFLPSSRCLLDDCRA